MCHRKVTGGKAMPPHYYSIQQLKVAEHKLVGIQRLTHHNDGNHVHSCTDFLDQGTEKEVT